MSLETQSYIELLRVITLVSVLFVWVIRYDNIIKEFQQYELPGWLRDFVGILKIISVVLINFSSPELSKLGAIFLAVLMGAAIFTHLRVKNPLFKMLPATTLFTISLVLFFNT